MFILLLYLRRQIHWLDVFQRRMFVIHVELIIGKVGRGIYGRRGLAPAFLMRII